MKSQEGATSRLRFYALRLVAFRGEVESFLEYRDWLGSDMGLMQYQGFVTRYRSNRLLRSIEAKASLLYLRCFNGANIFSRQDNSIHRSKKGRKCLYNGDFEGFFYDKMGGK